MPRFVPHDEQWRGEHRFGSYDCEAAGTDLVDELAAAVRELYVAPDALRSRLEDAAQDLEGIVDMDEIRDAIERVAEAAIPQPGTRLSQPQLDTARNELAEVVGYAALEEVYQASLPAKRVREKEIPGAPSRGVDAVALVDSAELRLLLGETKASSEDASPPGVVGNGDSSLLGQLVPLVSDHPRVLSELNWVLKHCSEESRSFVARAILLWVRRQLPVSVVPCLVRPVRCYQASDFGAFADDPDQVAPARVWFCLVRINGEIEELAEAVYLRARVAGAG